MRRSLLILFLGNFLSKALGLVREGLIAALFGTGQAAGAFRIAQTGTLAPVNFLTSDDVNSAFIPQYKKFREESVDKAQTFVWVLLILFGGVAALISGTLWTFAMPWIEALAPGLDDHTHAQAVSILRVMVLGVPFYLLAALLAFLSMARNDFVQMAVRPTAQNIGVIVGAALAFILNELRYFAWGFTGSQVALCCWMLWRSGRTRALTLPTRFQWPRVAEVIRGFWLTLRPLLVLPIIFQSNFIIERMVASLIGLAVVSALDYARFVSETLVFLVSMPIAFAGLAHWSGVRQADLRQRLIKVLWLLLMVSIPVSVFMAAHAHLIVEALYARGAFDAMSVQMTGDILFGMAIGLWAQGTGYVLIKALNSQMRNRAVLAIMAAALLANVVVNVTMHSELGALTLGVGNAAYGLITLVGALTALKLWKEMAGPFAILVSGSALYLLVDNWLLTQVEAAAGLSGAAALAAIFWASWIIAIPPLRQIILNANVFPQGRQ